MHPKAATSIPLGIAPRSITTAYYFWLQTWGPAACKAGGTLIAGRPAVPELGTNTGYIKTLSTETAATKSSDIGATGVHLPVIGMIMEVGATTQTGIVYLQIAS